MKHISIEDIFNIKSVSAPKAIPGHGVMYYVTTVNEKDNNYVTHLHESIDRGLKQLTFDKGRISQVDHSNDGNLTLFVAKGDNDKPQIFLLRRTGGEREQLTSEDEGVSEPRFSNDGTAVFYHVNVKEEDDKKEDDDKKDDKKQPVHITNMKYKIDGAPGPFGYVPEKKQVVKKIDIDTRKVETGCSGEADYSFMAELSDGIIYTTNESDDPDFNFTNTLYVRRNGEDKVVTLEDKSVYGVEVSKDEKHALLLTTDYNYKNAAHLTIELLSLDDFTLTDVTGKLDRPTGSAVVQDVQQSEESRVVKFVSNKEFVFLLSEDGAVNLYKGNIDGEVRPLLQSEHNIFGMDADDDTVYLTISTPVSPSELYRFDLETETLTQLTEVNKEFVDSKEIVTPESIRFNSFDDEEIHGWFMKPAGFKDGEKYPLVVNVHGGPHAFYAHTFFHEMQVLAGLGYAVLFTNPRGSHSYSQKFVDHVRGDYGNTDYKDVMASVDYVLDTYDFIDENRLGVTGGSYGGFMTNWIVGHTNRFKAAVTQRSISNWISFRGVSDIGYYFTDWQIQAGLDDIDTLWHHSPLKYVDNVETPLLILHSEYDFRCPIEQAEQLYIELKYRKKIAEFVRFPDADHNLSRTGLPHLRVKRLEYMTDWFKKYLNEENH